MDVDDGDGDCGAGRDAWAVVSRVNADVRCVDDIAFGDDRDDLVAQINLHGNCIETMDGLETFTRVVELCLSSNCIEEVSFHALQPLASLRVLDLSANRIESTLGFPQLPSLEELSLAHNRLKRLDGMTRPVKFPRLRYLDLRGNEIEEFNGLVALQRLKRLAQLRLQAHDGSLANPVCDLEDYQDTMIKMLPHLRLLDEEEVDLLREVGSIRMPKYRSIMRRIASGSHIDVDQTSTKGSPVKSEPSPTLAIERKGSSVTRRHSQATAASSPGHMTSARQPTYSTRSNQNPVNNSAEHLSSPLMKPSEDLSVDQARNAPVFQQERIVLKESSTNTEGDKMEEELAKRDEVLKQQATKMKETEQAFLTREKLLVDAQNQLEEQVTALSETLIAADVRADAAAKSLAEITTRLEAEAKEHADTQRRFDTAVSDLQRSLKAKDDDWAVKIADMTEQHRREIAAATAAKSDVDKALATLETRVATLMEKVNAQEVELTSKDAAQVKNEETIRELKAEMERWRAGSSAFASQLTVESKSHQERLEDSTRRAKQLEKQVVDLQTSLEAVYNKCIEKDEDIHQLKKSLLTKQGELDEIKTQHAKAMDRLDRVLQQQQDLYDKQLHASVLQLEMEFRKEHQQAVQQYQELQRRYHDSVKETRRLKEAYSLSRKREAGARTEIYKIQAILQDDKQKLYAEDAKRTDEFEHKLRTADGRCVALEKQIETLQRDNAIIPRLEQQLKDTETHADALRVEIERINAQGEAWKKQEDDLRAALKVKDVMLTDQQRQITKLRHEREEVEGRFNDEMAEFQAQVEELEAALDDSAQRAMDGEAKCEALEAEKHQLERQIAVLNEQVEEQSSLVEQQRTALDFIEQEMDRMRSALSNQDELFQKRLQKRVEQHNEELERIQVAAEEERERLLVDAEAARREVMDKFESLSVELQAVAAQNSKLRVVIEQERKKSAQNDHDMRVLLAQIDRERHMKQEHLRQIKSLFEQLQRDAP